MKPCKVFFSISPYLISEGRRKISSFQPSQPLSKYVAEYEQTWKWMVEFLKVSGRGIKTWQR